MNNPQYITLVEANYVNSYKIELRFSDATVREIDFEYFLKNHSHPQFDKYNDLQKFKKFKIERNNLVWGKNWDLIFPLKSLYEGKNPS